MQELNRNRDAKVTDALKTLKSQNLKLAFPQTSKSYNEYSQLRNLQRDYERLHSQLLQKLKDDALNKSLKADELIDRLFTFGNNIEVSENTVDKAKTRMDIGKPPEKKGSLGDAIN